MDDQAPKFLQNVLGSLSSSPCPATRPHVTLTFAQSLDAKIAGSQGRQLILSGKESMIMTHWMRTMHDAILVGIGTALNDDPQLNVRHLPHPPATPYNLPRPVIIDTHLRLSPACKLLKNYQDGTGKRPWIICSSVESGEPRLLEDLDKLLRKRTLEEAGARIIQISPKQGSDSPQLSIPEILKALKDLGICSLMVEGGAKVIASFLAESVVDVLIITTAPVLVGRDGISYDYPAGLANGTLKQRFAQKETAIFGNDSVVALMSVKTNIN